jgi:peptidoglycan hydrolase CwlO-like protein
MKVGDKQVNKKRIIITAVAGLASFGVMFALALFTNKTTPRAQTTEQTQESLPNLEQSQTQLNLLEAEATTTAIDNKLKKEMTEKQLKSLVYEIREKIQEYDNKLQGLQTREERLQTAHNIIKEDIKELNNLRVELASAIASLKEQRDKLLQSRVQVAQNEKANLMKIAAAYDKMQANSASKILANMCTGQIQNTGSFSPGGSMSDAVKILYYMTERTKAKLLSELSTSEPTLAAVLCQKLKQIVEE